MDELFLICWGLLVGYFVGDEKSTFWTLVGIAAMIIVFFTRTSPSDWGLV